MQGKLDITLLDAAGNIRAARALRLLNAADNSNKRHEPNFISGE